MIVGQIGGGRRRNLTERRPLLALNYWLEQVAMRPRVSFDSKNIWRRLEMCKEVARAYGWKSSEISSFSEEVNEAFSYEEAMAIIKRDFDVWEEPEDRLLGS
jgi:hypothetical protein